MRVSLVLGSGGARGYAHIGVIEELVAAGISIESISGSSMGALVGGLYAAGGMEEYKEWVLTLDVFDVATLLDLSFDKRGLIKGEKVFKKLEEIIGYRKIEDLPIKFTAVASDIKANKEIWFQEGDLLQAIRASISIPSFFTPVEWNDTLLVDGGVLNPLPVAPTMSDHTDAIIAVNVYGKGEKPAIELPKEVQKKQGKLEKAKEKLKKYSQKLIQEGEYNFFDIVDMSYDALQQTLIRYRLAGYPPDHLIEISQKVCGTYDFHKAYEVIEAGREAAKSFLKTL
ncbi:patatin-like phospholipase family protein [Nitratiruptor sp. SB155-2]|uniref:patatin-like phospholipase family protein n=1 Tax=Nitratiruptor sp. (strain SB155-2) TaxID=387092 RepID=UPI0001586FF8|nr:patatin-like phospholipase family protein [Nitratiruptor sp. SB155-2]BAF70824.1 patatin [Nitratiruptor sp. SB155-2]